MWTFGYTDPFAPDGPEDVILGDCSTFTEAIDLLSDFVEKELANAEMGDTHNVDHFDHVLGEIRMVKDDPGIRYDPDQWEDLAFTDDIGEIEYFVVEA